PAASRTWGTVGGAFRKPSKRASTACGARSGAPSATRAVAPTMAAPARRLVRRTGNRILVTGARIDDGQRDIRQQRAEREEHGARRGAAGHQVDVARPQRIE